MDTRTLTLTIALGTTACAGSVFPPALEESAPRATAPPATPEALAQDALERIAADCEDRRGCATYVTDDIYPDIAVPSAERYFASTLNEEVRSVGAQLRFEPGGSTLDVERGNTLTWEYGLNENPP